MKTIHHAKFRICFFLCLISCIQLSGQSWEKTFGGMNSEYGSGVEQASDGGFIVVGSTSSFGAGSSDIYVVKTNANGDTIWTKTFGGYSSDNGQSVQQTYDGGYIIGGVTSGAGSQDIYLIKTDANGITEWTNTIGSSVPESCSEVVQTKDSGYCTVGNKGDIGNGNTDIYLVRTDQNGDTLWTKTYGGSILDLGYSLQQTIDGGFIISGATYNEGENEYDAYLIKTNNAGDTLWTRIFNGSYSAYGQSVSQTSDNGYIMGGTSSENFYAVKVDVNGIVQWTKETDKGGGDRCSSVFQSSDGGYVMAGYTYTFLTDADVLIIKLDDNGDEIWSKKFGGNQWDIGSMIQPTNNVGFIIVGTSNSDIYLIKTGCDNFPTANIAILDTFCQGETLSATLFTNAQIGSTYQWTKNDTNLIGAVSPDNIVFAEGNYGLTITDSNGCSNQSDNLYINFPKPYFQVYPEEVCPGDNVMMGNWNGSTENYSSYDWDFGDGTTDTGTTTNHVYQNLGTYIITRTVKTANGSCNAYQDSVTISATALPPVDFDLLVNSENMLYNIACPGDKIEFISYAYTYLFVSPPPFDAASYLWNFGDGTTDTVPFPVHYYSQYGIYTITLTVTNHCGNANSVSSGIMIDSTVNASAYFIWTDTQGISNDTVNTCEQISFYATSGILYDWNFGDGTSGSTPSDTTSHTFTAAGNYNIQLIATNGCGKSDTLNQVIIVVGTCTGISSPTAFQGNNVVIYPNPFVNNATLQILPAKKNTPLTVYDLRIYDLQGRQVKQFRVDKLLFTIDREKLTGGMYFYKLNNGNDNIATGKFIIQ